MTRFEATIGDTRFKNVVRAVNIDEDFTGANHVNNPMSAAYFGKQANLQFFPSHKTAASFRIVGMSRVIPPPVSVNLFPTQRSNNPVAVSLRFMGQVKPYNSVVWGDEGT
jgi:hypothetical protein